MLLVVSSLPALGYEPGFMRTELEMAQLAAALNAFNIDLGRYPTSAEGLPALVSRPAHISTNEWHGPYAQGLIQDAWGRDFVYLCPGLHNPNGFDLYSCGKDGVSKSRGDDADDFNNWDSSKHWREYYAHAERMRQTMPLVYSVAAVVCLATVAWLISRTRRP